MQGNTDIVLKMQENASQRIPLSVKHVWENDRSSNARIYDVIALISQQASGRHFDTQTLKKHPSGHPIFWASNFIKCQYQEHNCIVFA